MKWKYLNLEEKIRNLDYAAQHPKLSQKLAEYFSTGKTATANIFIKGKNLTKDFELLKGTCKKGRHETQA